MSSERQRYLHPFRISGILAYRRDLLWTTFWFGGVGLTWLWLSLYLNAPARRLVQAAFVNTIFGALLVVAVALCLGWATALALHALERPGRRSGYLTLTFVLDLLRSVPQMVGMLLGYVIVTGFIRRETLTSEAAQIVMTSLITSIVVFQEVADLIRERIRHYEALDFVNALLVCGVSERVIINQEIILKNSLAHIVQKSVALFGRAIFLICSIDFIVSVGLSTDVSLSNLPVTLGSMLAKLDSKQDILVIGTVFTEPGVLTSLFIEHLQGISVAFLIVYTLLCVYKISNGLVERYRL